jgi:hypothetical protein
MPMPREITDYRVPRQNATAVRAIAGRRERTVDGSRSWVDADRGTPSNGSADASVGFILNKSKLNVGKLRT